MLLDRTMSREARANHLCTAYPVAARKARLAGLASAAVLAAVLAGSLAQGQDSGWKPSWQQPPVSSASRGVEKVSYTAKAAPASTAERARPVRSPAAVVAAPAFSPDQGRAGAVRQASAQLETPKEPPVRPVPQPEPVPQGQIVYEGQNAPVYSDGPPLPDENGSLYPGSCYPGCGPCGPCGDDCSFRLPFDARWFWPLRGVVYTRAEYLMWWAKGDDTPPLVATDALPAGTVLFGDTPLNNGIRSGYQVSLGLWMDPCQMSAVEAIYTGVGRSTETFSAAGDATDSLVRPFYDTNAGEHSYSRIAGTNLDGSQFTGNIHITADSEFHAFDLLFRRALAQRCGFRVDGLFGYRYTRLDEGLLINEEEERITAPTATQAVSDSFRTLNEFHGGEIGANLHWQWNRWSFNVLTKMALGYTRMRLGIAGSTLNDDTPPALTGGMLALASQVGSYHDTQFSVNPELGLTLGYDLTCRLRATFGYSLLYWSKVARPGDQIALNLNPNWFPAPTVTPPPFSNIVTTDYWAQGMNFGLEYRF